VRITKATSRSDAERESLSNCWAAVCIAVCLLAASSGTAKPLRWALPAHQSNMTSPKRIDTAWPPQICSQREDLHLLSPLETLLTWRVRPAKPMKSIFTSYKALRHARPRLCVHVYMMFCCYGDSAHVPLAPNCEQTPHDISTMYRNSSEGKKCVVCVVHSSCAGYMLPKLPSKSKAKRRTELNGGYLQADIYVYTPESVRKDNYNTIFCNTSIADDER
jgi:hypothetical protein